MKIDKVASCDVCETGSPCVRFDEEPGHYVCICYQCLVRAEKQLLEEALGLEHRDQATRLLHRWQALREWIEADIEPGCGTGELETEMLTYVLEKMNELERGKP